MGLRVLWAQKIYEFLDVGALVGVAGEVPAGLPSCMGEQGVDAGLRPWWVEEELRLAIFERNSGIMIHGDRTVGIPVGRNAQPEEGEVEDIGERGGGQDRKDSAEEDSLQSRAEAEWTADGRFEIGHGDSVYVLGRRQRWRSGLPTARDLFRLRLAVVPTSRKSCEKWGTPRLGQPSSSTRIQ